MNTLSCDQNHMKYGQIAPNDSVNSMIYICFNYIHEEDERKFVKEFRQQPNDSDQIMHTFRELVLGGFLSYKNLPVRYNYKVNNHTPDWCIIDDQFKVTCVIELTNFHIDKVTESEIEEELRIKNVVCIWKNNKPNIKRLYHCILNKAQLYNTLIEKLDVPYVISVFRHFYAPVNLEEVRSCLLNEDSGLFKMYPKVSGVLFFRDSFGRYYFNYECNPNALRSIDFPEGVFP